MRSDTVMAVASAVFLGTCAVVAGLCLAVATGSPAVGVLVAFWLCCQWS